jgi:hypothetical protein
MKMIPPAFVCRGKAMRRIALFLVTAILASIGAGCAPEDSLFPLYTKEESLFNERLVGGWRLQESPTDPKPEDGYLIISGGKDKNSYLVRGVDGKKPSGGIFLIARLVRLEAYTFIDFSPPDELDDATVRDLIYPYIPSHIFGRVRFEKNNVRLDLLDNDWVKKQIQAGTLGLTHIDTPNGPVISAPTEALRKFALEHVNDERAFSFTQNLVKEQ